MPIIRKALVTRRKKGEKFEPSGMAIVYLRVSTEKQVDSGLGLAAQEKLCREFCKRNGLEITGVFTDEGLTGTLGVVDRPGLLAAISHVTRGDVLVVAKLDRLARDVVIAHLIERDLVNMGARLVSASNEANGDDSPSGRLLRGILNLLAEYERAQTSWRTSQAMAALKACGAAVNSQIPYGMRIGRTVEIPQSDGSVKVRRFFEPNPEEVAVIDRMRTQRRLGLSFKDIADRLNADGIKTRHGCQWGKMQVRRTILRSMATNPGEDAQEG